MRGLRSRHPQACAPHITGSFSVASRLPRPGIRPPQSLMGSSSSRPTPYSVSVVRNDPPSNPGFQFLSSTKKRHKKHRADENFDFVVANYPHYPKHFPQLQPAFVPMVAAGPVQPAIVSAPGMQMRVPATPKRSARHRAPAFAFASRPDNSVPVLPSTAGLPRQRRSSAPMRLTRQKSYSAFMTMPRRRGPASAPMRIHDQTRRSSSMRIPHHRGPASAPMRILGQNNRHSSVRKPRHSGTSSAPMQTQGQTTQSSVPRTRYTSSAPMRTQGQMARSSVPMARYTSSAPMRMPEPSSTYVPMQIPPSGRAPLQRSNTHPIVNAELRTALNSTHTTIAGSHRPANVRPVVPPVVLPYSVPTQMPEPTPVQPPFPTHSSTPARIPIPASMPTQMPIRTPSPIPVSMQMPTPRSAPPVPRESTVSRLNNPLPLPPQDIWNTSPYRQVLANLPTELPDLLDHPYQAGGLVDEPEPVLRPPSHSGSLFGRDVRNMPLNGLFRSRSTAGASNVSDGTSRHRHSRSATIVIPPPAASVGSSAGARVRAGSATMNMPAPTARPLIKFDHMGEYAGFLNHSPHRVMYKNKPYPTALHLFEALKFIHHPALQEQIRASKDVRDMYPLSASFQKHVRPDWGQVFLKTMEDVLYLKFKQHPTLRALLLRTGLADIVYSDENTYWGDGSSGQGANELGKALVRLRERLRQDGES